MCPVNMVLLQMILCIIDTTFDDPLYFDPQCEPDLPISLATDLYFQNTYS